jgi:aerobic-type carbon monoxide dehydrogenase small subunit (CoxS/CutS family)
VEEVDGPARIRIRYRINGAARTDEVEPRRLLSDFIRHTLHLTGTHVGCEMGVCGACTVLVDGEAVRACLMLAVQLDGRDVRTVEALGTATDLAPLQRAFQAHHALQCGYCTPGILMTLTALAEGGEWPRSEAAAREALSGHLCRCTGYQNIVAAVLSLAPGAPRSAGVEG